MRTLSTSSLVVIVAVCIAGCAGLQPIGQPGGSASASSSVFSEPDVLQGGGLPEHWARLHAHVFNLDYQGLAVGPDHVMWTAAYESRQLVRITMNGGVSQFDLPNFYPQEVVLGADGMFYLNTPSGAASIARVSTTGTVHIFNLPDLQWAYGVMAVGPDGNVWFTEQTLVGRLTPQGQITQFNAPGSCDVASSGFASGPDGNMWYTASCVNRDKVVKVDPTTGTQTSFEAPEACPPGGQPIITGPDHNLWFTCNSNAGLIGKITTAGKITTYKIPSTRAISLAAGPDGAIWYIEDLGTASNIGRVDPKTGHAVLFKPPPVMGRMAEITAGPDGNMWMSSGSDMDIYVLKALEAQPESLTFSQPGGSSTITITEKGTTSWTAASSNRQIATVAKGQMTDQFVVTAVGTGQCNISVKDAIGNIVHVSVTVQ